MIRIGDTVPSITLKAITPSGVNDFSTDIFRSQGKIVIFGVPGAFTPTCSATHVPGFFNNAESIKAKGVSHIYCISINDSFVMQAWYQYLELGDEMTFLADGNGELTKAMGLELDGRAAGLGIRSQRYTMVIENGIVSSLVVEGNPGQCIDSSGESLLAIL